MLYDFLFKVDFGAICENTGDYEKCNPSHVYKLDSETSYNHLKELKEATTKTSVNTFIGTKDGYMALYPAKNTSTGNKDSCNCLQFDPRYR